MSLWEENGCLPCIGNQKDITTIHGLWEPLKTQSKTKKSVQKCEKMCQGHLNPEFFSKNFVSDPLKIFSKPMRAIIIRITC